MSEYSGATHQRLRRSVERLVVGDELGVPGASEVDSAHAFLVDSVQTLTATKALLAFAGRAGTVLVSGPTGVGKRMWARLLHALDGNADRPMLTLDLSKLDSPRDTGTLLFGRFQAGRSGAPGYLECAEGGTLVLRGIECLPVDLEAPLQQALMEGDFQRMGGGKRLSLGCRVVVTTRRLRETNAAAARMASPLMYALLGHHVALPPLARRGSESIERLTYHFIRHAVARSKRSPPRLSDTALRALQAYGWPHNILEIKQIILAAALIAPHTLEPSHLPEHIVNSPFAKSIGISEIINAISPIDELFRDQPTIEQLEARYIAYLLERHAKNRSAVARILGMGRNTLISKIHRYRLG
jgi:DNA-binding NtrC family response regulator